MTRSPTIRFLLGLLVTLGALTGFSSYSLYRLHGLRKFELNIIDLDRHEALQLLRVQNDLNAIGLKLRDLSSDLEKPEIRRYKQEIDVMRLDLSRALGYESRLMPVTGGEDQRKTMAPALDDFWNSSDAVFTAAEAGDWQRARDLISSRLSGQQAELARRVSALLERNNAWEEQADRKVAEIYEDAERDIYLFLAVTMVGVAATSLYLISWNRKLFERLEYLSGQRRVLTAKLISVQEEVLRSVSRELHDEFGQILTAVGAMLARAERLGVPPGSPLRTELSEVREITHATLEKIRGLSQMLHPAVIDDYGLAKAVEWYVEVFERQTGVKTRAQISGRPIRITGQPAIHCFRIVQEALNNAAKHSGTEQAEVSMMFGADDLLVVIRDFGRGVSMAKRKENPGLGLIAMQERAAILHGKVNFTSSPENGTTVTLTMPLRFESGSEDAEIESKEEVYSQTND